MKERVKNTPKPDPEPIPRPPGIKHIRARLSTGGEVECPVRTPVGELIEAHDPESGLPCLGALVNNVCSMSYPLTFDCTVEPLTFADRHGSRIYRRSLSFVLAKATRDLFPDAVLSVEHSLGNGYFCNFSQDGRTGIGEDQLRELDDHLRDLVARDLRIIRRNLSFEQAYEALEVNRQFDKLNLLRYRNPPRITVFHCESFTDLDYGVMAPSTGALSGFKLLPYQTGFVLQFPQWVDGRLKMIEYTEQPHLFDIYRDHKRWGNIIGINTVGDLNQTVAEDKVDELIRISEVFQEKKFAHIADQVLAHHDRVKWILIAGPSSAGKTTFSKRLAVHLRVNGLRPRTLECDNYFVDREHTPRDEHGEFDFEHLEAIDLDMLREHLLQLSEGREVEIPRFNFHHGYKEFHGDLMQLHEDEVVLIEGIHCLNPELTRAIDPGTTFKIYVNCITQLKLDLNNRISTTDMRLMRRMVRDHRTRGNDALRTLQFWPSVRRGEKRWIFPFQIHADAVFNSSLDYELAVFKPMALPLLTRVKPHHREYAEARRLQDFLEVVINAPTTHVPATSLLREFIGGSVFA